MKTKEHSRQVREKFKAGLGKKIYISNQHLTGAMSNKK